MGGGLTVTGKGGEGRPSPQEFVAKTVNIPEEAPAGKSTIIALVPIPAVMMAPGGTDHV
jgi:hypothetical protein